MNSLNSDQQLNQFLTLHPRRINLSLERIERLLARLGHPERCLPPVIHVAGTNGKGSVIAYLLAGLEAAKRRVHVYTSPHLVRFHERIRLASNQGAQPISEDKLIVFLQRCEQANDGAPITFFEITTAAAFLAFAEYPADHLLLETGLGGRLDATQMAKGRRILSIITPVSLDHQLYLGDNLASIAKEKAGIIGAGKPVFVGPQQAEAARVIFDHAKKLKALLACADIDWHVEVNNQKMILTINDKKHRFPLPALAGVHQVDNAGLALAVLMCPPIGPLPQEVITRALTEVCWPGRLQRLDPELLGISSCVDIWIDGAHNSAGAEALSDFIQGYFTQDTLPRLICGMMAHHDPASFLEQLMLRINHIVAIPIPGQNCHPPALIATAACALGFKAESAPNLEAALYRLTRESCRPILITGSLYLMGHILHHVEQAQI